MKTDRWPLSIAIGISICLNVRSFAATIQVPVDQPTIQAGIDAAENGDTVLVADGTYTGDGNGNIDFKGKAITVQSLNGPMVTIIDCQKVPNTRGVVFQNEETNASVLDGFTITNGVIDNGGGIYCKAASPTIQNGLITRNQATKDGGGIYCENSSALITDCTIRQNQMDRGSGGVFFTGDSLSVRSPPNLINCTISENRGSGVFCHDSVRPLIKDCVVSRNRGCGIECNFFARGAFIANCLIEQNTDGGVKCIEESFLVLSDCIIKQNTAENGGGIFCSPTSSVQISGCIIAQNAATQSGGGISVNSTRGSATITTCTITQNTANDHGGGVFALIELGGPFSLSRSIVWDNMGGDHEEIFAGGGQITIESCDIGSGLAGIGRQPDGKGFIYENNSDASPRFADAFHGDYRLLPNSPAIGPPLMGARPPLGGPFGVEQLGKQLMTWGVLKVKSLPNSRRVR